MWELTDNMLVDKNYIMQYRDETAVSKVCTKQGCVDFTSMATRSVLIGLAVPVTSTTHPCLEGYLLHTYYQLPIRISHTFF